MIESNQVRISNKTAQPFGLRSIGSLDGVDVERGATWRDATSNLACHLSFRIT